MLLFPNVQLGKTKTYFLNVVKGKWSRCLCSLVSRGRPWPWSLSLSGCLLFLIAQMILLVAAQGCFRWKDKLTVSETRATEMCRTFPIRWLLRALRLSSGAGLIIPLSSHHPFTCCVTIWCQPCASTEEAMLNKRNIVPVFGDLAL